MASNPNMDPAKPSPTGGTKQYAHALDSTPISPTTIARQAVEYGVDFWQRSVLYLDILRQRGNKYYEHAAEAAPNVLTFQFEPVMTGLDLERPVNYGLVKIVPPSGIRTDPKKRPFIVFDPRAGHGPGIGGMKHDSEIGVALLAGHPCYFVGFLPYPVAGQTIEDVCRAEALFVREVAKLHPDADGKPCLVGNCQAGWQIMMTSAVDPEPPGPIILAGSPLSFWNGVHGKDPLRYLGGLLGGTWLTSLAGDLGDGIFDGAYLIANFEALNPANTYWEKRYNVFSKADTEGPRFLEFETWWGSPTLLNAIEMQSIADDLFVGNKLSSGDLYTSDGVRVDLRNIKSPVIVFCSFGDNITPPQQALGWILDLYDSDEDLIANGQTIIYCLHQTVGHLGIFVSARVATKEHQEFVQTMDMIDTLPPGLYEAVITQKSADMTGAELVAGDYIVRFESRTLADLRTLGGNDTEDDTRFATVAHLSEATQGLYRTYVSPIVQTLVNRQTAEWLRAVHPYRLRYQIFSDRNPFMRAIEPLAEDVRIHRFAADTQNPFLLLQHQCSQQIVDALNRYQAARDSMIENWFMTVYGSPAIQALFGLQADSAVARRRSGRDLSHRAAVERARKELETSLNRGGLPEAAIRALLYIGLGQSVPGADARRFALLRQFRAREPEAQKIGLAKFKELVREQYLLLRLDEDRAVAAIPELLPADPEPRSRVLNHIRDIALAAGELESASTDRLDIIEAMFRGSRPSDLPTREFRARTSTAAAVAKPAVSRASGEP